MANRIKLKGTTVDSFDIGLQNRFTFDASSLTAANTWVIPDGNGSAGYTLTNDGSGVLSWEAVGAATDQTTPYYIPFGDTFTNNENRQNLYSLPIEVDGDLEVDGYLVDVSGNSEDHTTPYLIEVGETFTNNYKKQNLFMLPIEVLGTLVVNGYIIDAS